MHFFWLLVKWFYKTVKYARMVSSCSAIPAGIFVVSMSYIIYKKFFKKQKIAPKPAPYKKDFKKDVVYLYQFKRVHNCPNLSPFCMKIEILCRANSIPYEVCDEKRRWSRNGTIPFIELNGEHIADSDLVEHRLRKHFNIPSLPQPQEAQAVALGKLADNHLFNLLIRYKSEGNGLYVIVLGLIGAPKFLSPVLLPILRRVFSNKIYTKSKLAIGDFDPEDMKELFYKDLQVIQDYLGEQKFLFGDKIQPVDATVFGHLASVYYPFRNPICDVLEKDFPNILEYLERVRHEVYPNDFTV